MIVPHATLTRQRYRMKAGDHHRLHACPDWVEEGATYEGDIDPSSQESFTAQIRLFHPDCDGRSCVMDESHLEEVD